MCGDVAVRTAVAMVVAIGRPAAAVVAPSRLTSCCADAEVVASARPAMVRKRCMESA
jgi:hypothetical protein